MAQELCILHANCQGMPLAKLLLAAPGFRARWHVRGVLNYKREPLTDAHLAEATLFLYQNLTAKWEMLASENVLQRLSPTATAVCVPNPFFKGYWPFWTNRDANGKVQRFADIYLERLFAMGLTPGEALHLYLNRPLRGKYDLDALLEESWALEAERESPCAFQTLPWVLARWRTERLFTTINHPCPDLLRFMADNVLEVLGFPPLTDADIAGVGLNAPGALLCDPSPEEVFEMPIHPQVAANFGLPFGGPETRYAVWDRRLSFADYAKAYVTARTCGIDLYEYLARPPADA